VIKVLVVDDSALVRKLLARVFAAEDDFDVQVARDGVEALERLKSFQPDVITLDIHMPQMDGLACLDRIMVERPSPVVMVSTQTAEGAETTLEALRLGAIDFIAKPGGAVSLRIDELAPELVAKVRAAAGAKLRSSARLKERVRHRIGAMPAALRLSESTERIADRTLQAASGDGLVLVGASTGGPPALEALLTALPADFPWPILVAQHMPASFTGPLARRLDRICALTVSEVLRPTVLEAGWVHIGRGDADLIVSRRQGGLTALAAPPLDYPWHPSVDRLVRTAMEQVPASQLIGVLMTGMGDDGADAMTQLHARGGRTIAEAAESAVVWGMPGELAKAGGADAVLPLHKIAGQLLKLVP
jgi:two-component system chemotaxis response regulator CheB